NGDPKVAATAADNLNTRTTPPPTTIIERTRSNDAYRMGKVLLVSYPPFPKLSTCGFCTAFSKTWEKGRPAKSNAKHRSRYVFSSGRRRLPKSLQQFLESLQHHNVIRLSYSRHVI
ncbi:hypothetical protein V8G54_017087, partial [Vigna mungo]